MRGRKKVRIQEARDEMDLSPIRDDKMEYITSAENIMLYQILSIIRENKHLCGRISNSKLKWCGYENCRGV